MNNHLSTSSAEFFERNGNVKKYRRKKRCPYKLYLPENLDIDSLLREKPPSFKFYRDNFVYILHLISSIPSHIKDFDLEKNKGFIPINKDFLSRRVHNYKDYIEYLKENKIIREGTNYLPNFYSRGLKFCRKYQTKITGCYITKNTLIKSITERNDNRDLAAERTMTFLKNWFNPKLVIDREKAAKFLEEDRIKSIEKIEFKRASKKRKKYATTVEELATFGYNQKLIIVDKLANGKNYRLSIDKTSGRFHSPLTNLKKELRKFIKYEDEILMSVDIINSQPFLSLVVIDLDLFVLNGIDKYLIYYNKEFTELNEIITDEIIVNGLVDKDLVVQNIEKRINKNKQQSSSTMLVNLLLNSSQIPDVLEYKNSVANGRFYELFYERLSERGLIPSYLVDKSSKRKFAKKAMFSALFSKNSSLKWNKYSKAFQECYPTVYTIFSIIKIGSNNTLACLLQRFESDLVLNNTCVDINKLYPEAPIFTIHDSIATTKRNIKNVRQIFENNIQNKLYIKPNFSIEVWN